MTHAPPITALVSLLLLLLGTTAGDPFAEDAPCGQWSLRLHLFPYEHNRLNYTVEPGLVRAEWYGYRDTQRATVYHALHPVSSLPAATADQLSAGSTPQSLLLTSSKDGYESPRATVVVQVRDNRYDYLDMLADDANGLNMWHFHANAYPLTLSLHIADIAAYFLNSTSRSTETDLASSSNSSFHIPNLPALPPGAALPRRVAAGANVLLLLPPHAWQSGVSFANDTSPIFPPRPETHPFLASPTSLAGLQGIAAAFGDRLLAASYETSLARVRAALAERNWDTTPAAWVLAPPRDGFMWNLGISGGLFGPVGDCKYSTMTRYAETVIGKHEYRTTKNSNIASHVCVMSRQDRSPGKRPPLRNLTPRSFSALLAALPSPLVMHPVLALQRPGSKADAQPEWLGRSSVAGQLRTVRRECAVLLGVHGAGLTSALGLRPGTTVVELSAPGRSKLFFNQLARVLPDVSYREFFVDDAIIEFREVFGHNISFEHSLYMSDHTVRTVSDFVRRAAAESVRKQRAYRDKQHA